MNGNRFIRQSHRWISLVFTVAVIINIGAMSMGISQVWIGFLALVPLILLMCSGLYLFFVPYFTGKTVHGRVSED